MKRGEENYFLRQEYLSNIELYYTTDIVGDTIKFKETEYKHITKVMRHSIGDKIYATDGFGNQFEIIIKSISKTDVVGNIISCKEFVNNLANITFCFPRLKSNDRFEFELEKITELGITNILILNTQRTIPKGEKLERWNKVVLAAMKQSLRTHLPKIEYLNSIEKLNLIDGEKIIFDQKGNINIIEFLNKTKNKLSSRKTNFIFGPEGGLSEMEINKVLNHELLSLTENRLRAETAVITAATAISLF